MTIATFVSKQIEDQEEEEEDDDDDVVDDDEANVINFHV